MTFPNAAMSIWADTVVSRWLPPPGSEWLLLVWVAAVGACFGSFMNVVIYRLPAGLSIIHPGSRCPQCGHAIRGFDNIPVLSWMILRGRCRDCGTSIATRYPTVEAFVALVATALALVDLFPDWVGLVDDASSIDAWNSATPWLRWAGHLLLGCTLICASLIEFDGHVVPWRLFLPAGLAGAAALVVVPLATGYAPEPRGGQDLSQRLVSHGIGLIVAVGCGLAIASLDRRPTANWTARCLPLILACVVIEWWLGWPATLVIAAGTSMAWIATRVVARAWPAMGRTGTMTSLTMTTLLILFATHWLVHVLPPLTAAG